MLCSSGLWGQAPNPVICLDFEDFDLEVPTIGRTSGLESGDAFYSNNEIKASVQNFYYPDGTSGFENILKTKACFIEDWN